MLGLYVFVFGYIFGGSFAVRPNETKTEYALGIFIGLTIFGFLAEVINSAPIAISSNPNFVKKVVFPLEILPATNVGAAAFHFLISLGLALLGLAFFGSSGIHLKLLWLPVIIAPLMLLAMGAAWILSAIGVFFRDIGYIIQFLVTALMYASAVFYSAAHIPAAMWTFLRFNPVLLGIELARNTSLWEIPVNYHHLLYLYIVGFIVFSLGHLVFKQMRPAFADVL